MREKITKIAERWFLTEPALFSIYCRQQLRENCEMSCMVRCGKGFVEINPVEIANREINDEYLEELFRCEMIRLFLKHPYERQIENVLPAALTIGSDITISPNYDFKKYKLLSPDDYQLPKNQCFEWYVIKLDVILRNSGNNSDEKDEDNEENNERNDNESRNESDNCGNNNDNKEFDKNISSKNNKQQNDRSISLTKEQIKYYADQAELWEEDLLKQQEINELIRETTDWGTIPGNIVEQIIASLTVKLDYRKVLSSFHTSILSSKRRLTRMKPNRRNGFLQMGSRYDLASKLLVAVDVSGSIDTETLTAFYSTIARFFTYGVESIDVVQFDVGLREVTTFKKRPMKIGVTGRGGTEFQSIFDYLKTHREYDGCLIFTDGYAPEPKVDFHLKTKILWVCRNEIEYNNHHEWMSKTGKACWIEF